jgi:hypothetical protein
MWTSKYLQCPTYEEKILYYQTKDKTSNTVKTGRKGEGKTKNKCALASLKFFSLGNSLLSVVEVEETASNTTSINTINLQNISTLKFLCPTHSILKN